MPNSAHQHSCLSACRLARYMADRTEGGLAGRSGKSGVGQPDAALVPCSQPHGGTAGQLQEQISGCWMCSTAERRQQGRGAGCVARQRGGRQEGRWGEGTDRLSVTARESLSERLQRAKPASVSLAGKGERYVRREVGREACEERDTEGDV